MTTTLFQMARPVLLGLALIAGPAISASGDELDLSNRAALQAEIRAYILENPETIREALILLEQQRMADEAKEEGTLVANLSGAIFEDGFSYVGGNPEGSVTVVEFQDYRCGYCKRAHGAVQELINTDDDIRLIVKEFPILGEDSVTLSRMAIATLIAEGPEEYKRMSDALMTYSGPVNDAALKRIARSADVDFEAVMAAMDDPEVQRRIGTTHGLARELKISGTPTFIIGDKVVRGYIPLDDMREVVRIARKAKN